MDTLSITPAMRQRTVRVGMRRVFLSEAGEGPAVLMLHGGGPGASGLSNYARNIEALARHFRVLVPDMPGFGQSTKGVDRNDPFGDLADGMLGLLDALGIPNAHAVGNSLGGACALRMALEHPQKIGRLVLMGPGGVNTTRQVPAPGLKRLLNYYKGTGPSLEKITEFIRGDLVFDGSLVPQSMIEERFQASIDPAVVASPPLLGPKGIPKFSNIDFTRDRRLASVRNPTLVLWGVDDKVNRPSGAYALQKRMPNCDVYMFSNTGHWVQWERPNEFNAAVLTFLAQSDAKARVVAAR
ncbi:alpha/beta fold hydrolase [Burkholderia cepacia]|uniref:alpha/beta fold hydrolase n=1 Tax=Burkholderia cepacia TaxID=292 RepID=UPI001C931B43|nr:alpha/beta fold hydrolase [Burkholderia cepacia]MBY4715128.1 alpha/beta fold hydrolase [Burkholderia cepacia]MBY4735452.1 alpha/beta fold hydrolase [Burkholderia cepacia]MBY4748715.1 alpha/beta fold hydrolase [Burkholderia cepacia]MBY4755872.1 alpha/beta fold hydrolase [Burkholderia cepacia]MBY4773381.1 alpha/beta fold hydrolase [Burkholderia cepacia]